MHPRRVLGRLRSGVGFAALLSWLTLAPQSAANELDQHWYFEALSSDGKRALLRELDLRARSTFHVRSIEIDTGAILDEATLPELAKIPVTTIGGEPTALAGLEWMLASSAFARDLSTGAQLVQTFPFGECGRLAAGPYGSAIAFDAGDWLYVADETGRVRRRVAQEAAYDPRFTPDGKHILFRRAIGTVDVFAKYELFVVPSDLAEAPRALPNTAGVRDRFVMHPDGKSAVAVATQSRGRSTPETCLIEVGLRPPFSVKRLACVDGPEQLVEFAVSPKGKWAALSTKKRIVRAGFGAAIETEGRALEWRLRVLSLQTGKVAHDEPDMPGLGIRAISDSGLLVQSGVLGVVVRDIPAKTFRALDPTIDLGHRGVFRNDSELVYAKGGSVAVLDVARP
jgi:hypothetical protein